MEQILRREEVQDIKDEEVGWISLISEILIWNHVDTSLCSLVRRYLSTPEYGSARLHPVTTVYQMLFDNRQTRPRSNLL
jgi:hypothetical protein